MRKHEKHIFPLLALVLPLLLLAGPALAQDVPFDVEIGYRWLDTKGNEDMYRSQINERAGFSIRSLTFASGASEGWSAFDHVRLDVSDLGASPAGSFRLEGGLTNSYNIKIDYRRFEHYSALPAFANPLLDAGIIPGQHRYDRRRNSFGVAFEFLKWGSITPFIDYHFDRLDGPGHTTYTVGQDDFQLNQDLTDTSQEIRVGARVDAGPITGEISQGWRKVKESEDLTLSPGAGDGNNPGTVLGVPVSLQGLARSTETEMNTPVTNAFLTGRIGDRVKVTGSYARATAENDTTEAENLTGNLVSFQLSRFYGGLTETLASKAKNEWRRGTGRVDVNVVQGVDLTAGWTRDHSELEGIALISTLYLQTVTFSGFDPKDLAVLLNSRNGLDRTNTILDAGLKLNVLGPVTLRAGWSLTKQNVTSTPDVAEIVLPAGEGGDFDRSIKEFDLGANFSLMGVTLGADWRRERTDDLILRSDFLTRDRYRLRAGLNLMERVRFAATAMQLDTENDRAGIGYDARMRQYGGSLDVTPVDSLNLRANADQYEADSTVLVRVPETWTTATSLHSEVGRSWGAGINWKYSIVSLDAAYSDFNNKGNYPFTVRRTQARAEFEVSKNVSVAGEWARDKYIEDGSQAFGDYKATRYALSIHWKQ